MKKIGLVPRIIAGLLVGAVLGLFVNATKITYLNWITIFGSLYIGALKAMAPILVFVLVMDSLAGGSGSKKQSSGIRNVIILYFVSSFAASALAVCASYAWKVAMPGLQVAEVTTEQLSLFESIKSVILSVVSNPVKGIIEGSYLPILFWGAMIGLCLKHTSLVSKSVLHDFASGITKVIQGIIKFAPIGVLGLVFEAVSTNGAGIFVEYGKLIALLVLVMLVVMFGINPLIVGFCIKKNPYPLVFKCIVRSGINAFFTRSSAANIPINMDLCDELKLDKEIYSVTIPLGATINMAGAAAVIAIMTLSTAWALNMNIPFGFALSMCFVATVAAAGAAGVAGGSLMLIPLACSLFGIDAGYAWYAVGVGGTIGVIQDSVETAVNSSSDVLLTAAAEMMTNKGTEKKISKNI